MVRVLGLRRRGGIEGETDLADFRVDNSPIWGGSSGLHFLWEFFFFGGGE